MQAEATFLLERSPSDSLSFFLAVIFGGENNDELIAREFCSTLLKRSTSCALPTSGNVGLKVTVLEHTVRASLPLIFHEVGISARVTRTPISC